MNDAARSWLDSKVGRGAPEEAWIVWWFFGHQNNKAFDTDFFPDQTTFFLDQLAFLPGRPWFPKFVFPDNYVSIWFATTGALPHPTTSPHTFDSIIQIFWWLMVSRTRMSNAKKTIQKKVICPIKVYFSQCIDDTDWYGLIFRIWVSSCSWSSESLVTN